METCDLSRLSDAERKRWIGWEPSAPPHTLVREVCAGTPPELMPDLSETKRFAAQAEGELNALLSGGVSTRERGPLPYTLRRRASKGRKAVPRTDAERLLILAGYKPMPSVCRALETDANYRAAIHRTALKMTGGHPAKRSELARVYEALCR